MSSVDEFRRRGATNHSRMSFNILADLRSGNALSGQPNRESDGLRTHDAFGVVVRAFRGGFGHLEHFFARFGSPTDGADAHAATVAHRVVGRSHFPLVAIVANPMSEATTVASSGKSHREFCIVFADVSAVENPVGSCGRHHRVVGEE